MMLSRVIPRATSLLPRAVSAVSVRHGSGGGKTDLEMILETKRHMDDIPVPTRPWEETYNEAQKTLNLKLNLSIVSLILMSIASYKLDVFQMAPFMFKRTDIVLSEDMKLNDYEDDEED